MSSNLRRWHRHHDIGGKGPIQIFPVQENNHNFTLCFYVKRNPPRTNLVTGTEQWRWLTKQRFHSSIR